MQNFIYMNISFWDLVLSECVRMMVFSAGIFGYKIECALQMAECINAEFESLVIGTMNYLRT